jgi:hypothetical protein
MTLPMNFPKSRVHACLLLALGLAGPAWADTAPGGSSHDDLAAKATDPTAALLSFQLSNWYTARYHDVDGSSNQVVGRAALPFVLAGTQNIFRLTQAYNTNSLSGKTGIGDTQMFNLTVFGESWGRWGVGAAGSAPTGATGFSAEKWTLGPALGFVNSATKGINWGLFTQTFFSIGGDKALPDVGIINIQPIFGYQLGQGRSLSLGSSALIYDTKHSRWSSLQLGVNYGQVVKAWGHMWRPNAEVNYDFQDRSGNPQTTVRVGVSLLLPVN